MYVKFGDDPISSLDFSFIGGVPLNQMKKCLTRREFLQFLLLRADAKKKPIPALAVNL